MAKKPQRQSSDKSSPTKRSSSRRKPPISSGLTEQQELEECLAELQPQRKTKPPALTAADGPALEGLEPVGGELDLGAMERLAPTGAPSPAAPAVEEDSPPVLVPRFCLCEMPDGEFPSVRVFPNQEGLLRRLGSLEGELVNVWCFYGVPLRLSQANAKGRRYLKMGHRLFLVPLAANEPLQEADESEIELELQDDGWLGPPTMAADNSEYLAGNEALRQELGGWDEGTGPVLLDQEGEEADDGYKSDYLDPDSPNFEEENPDEFPDDP
jgi:hypothetical protein